MSITVPKENVSVLRFTNLKKIHEDAAGVTFEVPTEYASMFFKLVAEVNKNKQYYNV